MCSSDLLEDPASSPTLHAFLSSCRSDLALEYGEHCHCCRLKYRQNSLSFSFRSLLPWDQSWRAFKRTTSGANRAVVIQPTRRKTFFHQASQGSFGTSRCNAAHVHKNIVEAQLKMILGTRRQSWTSLQIVVEDDAMDELGEAARTML